MSEWSKERVLRTLVEKRVGSNPTPCTPELLTDNSEVQKNVSFLYWTKYTTRKMARRRIT